MKLCGFSLNSKYKSLFCLMFSLMFSTYLLTSVCFCDDAPDKAKLASDVVHSGSAGTGWMSYPPLIKTTPHGFETWINVILNSSMDETQKRAVNVIQLEDMEGYLLGQKIFTSGDEVREAEFMMDLSKTEMEKVRIVVISTTDGSISSVVNLKKFGETEMKA